MIRLLTILMMISVKSLGQDYISTFVTVPKEPGVVNYQLQKSSNNITWTTFQTFSPKKANDSNRYVYTLPAASSYWRIKTLMTTTTLYSPSNQITNTNVSITNTAYRNNTNSDNLSFTASNEAAVEFYNIERQNSTSSKWVIVGKLMQTGRRNYTVNVTKVGSNRKYRMISVYKNAIKSPYISFN